MEGKKRGGAAWRTAVLARHLTRERSPAALVQASACVAYSPPESYSENPTFDKSAMRLLLDGHDLATRDYMFNLMASSDLFVSRRVGDKVFAGPDYNQPMDNQREQTMDRILFFLGNGVFKGWLTRALSYEDSLKRAACFETLDIFDHSLAVKLGVHFTLWGDSIKYLGSKRHHDKWLKLSEEYKVRGCFAMNELGHGSNVRGLETVTTYDPSTQEFIIDTPCESAQKYWIGGAAKHATHTVVFSQLLIEGRNEGVHAFVCPLRDAHGNVCAGIRIADCGHKIGLNGVDNGRIWYAMSFAALDLKKLYMNRRPEDSKIIHVSSSLKGMCSWHNLRVLQECREACGGQGLKTDNRVGHLKAESDVQLTFEGDNNVLMQQVSKAVLGDYFAAGRNGKPMKGMGLEYMNGPRPVIPEELSTSILRDSRFQLALFQAREQGLLELLAAQVTNLLAKGVSMSDALSSSYQLATDLGVAFSERSVLESFLAAERQAAGPVKEVLGMLRTLYVLSAADEEPVFLRYSYLSPKQSQRIRSEVPTLCAELRPQALHLVDSFGTALPWPHCLRLGRI